MPGVDVPYLDAYARPLGGNDSPGKPGLRYEDGGGGGEYQVLVAGPLGKRPFDVARYERPVVELVSPTFL